MSNRLLIGLLATGFAFSLSEACSHGGGSGSTGTAGTSATGTAGTGTGNSGAAGTSATGSAGTSATGSAGTFGDTGTAGTTGAGNSVGSAGTSGDAGTSGSAGTTGAGGMVTLADMIDNLEDNDRQIIAANGRQGPWHSFNDSNGGNIQPPLGTGFVAASGGANNTAYAVHTTGSNYQFGGVGFDLNNGTTTPESMQSMAYNASAYNGLTFWAKGSGTLRVEFAMRSFVPTDRGGSCTSNCWNVYGANTPTLTSTWTQITIPWAGMQREQGGTSPAFNASELMSISFKGPGTFDFWIDEVAFTRTGGGPGTAGTTGRGGTTGTAGTSGNAGRGGTTGTAGTTGMAGTTGTGGNEPMPPPITSGGQNAWASRYWDCCKPACGWTGNTGGRQPIKSCNMQNQTLSTYTDKNACEGGGTAFMCWNGAPWQVGPNLSYGFVAASGSNYSCGRCYQLQFNGSGHNGASNNLNGKMMIVQVINNGGVAQDQFDLLIPGGGVGALNACTNQWGTSDLGATYGGFLANCSGDTNAKKTCVLNKCMQVFGSKADLMAGCNWFVNWFEVADNPNLVAKEITCPQMIKDRGLP
jgi:hypothetical protein